MNENISAIISEDQYRNNGRGSCVTQAKTMTVPSRYGKINDKMANDKITDSESRQINNSGKSRTCTFQEALGNE